MDVPATRCGARKQSASAPAEQLGMLPSTSMTAAARKATYADIEALPEHVTGELVDGVLYTQAQPAGPHVIVASDLGALLGPPFGFGSNGPGGWFLLDEPELHLGEDVFVPDLAGWRVERLPPSARRAAFIDIVPDWVCEIASPSTSIRDRRIKAPAYARHGVSHLWLVEPVEGRVEAYERLDTRWLVTGTWGDDVDARIPPFDAVPLDLARLWERAGRER